MTGPDLDDHCEAVLAVQLGVGNLRSLALAAASVHPAEREAELELPGVLQAALAARRGATHCEGYSGVPPTDTEYSRYRLHQGI